MRHQRNAKSCIRSVLPFTRKNNTPTVSKGFCWQVLRRHRVMYEKAMAAQAKKHARKAAIRGVDEGAKKYRMTETVEKMKVTQ